MITVREETTEGALMEGLALAHLHYYEVESKQDKIPYNPNVVQFKELLKLGMMLLVTARDDEGKMVGYFLMLVVDDLLTGSPSAQELGIFVTKEHRRSGLFLEMHNTMEMTLKEEGFKEMRIMFKTGHNTELPLSIGYEETERVYQKLI